jgi:hypothetical protein
VVVFAVIYCATIEFQKPILSDVESNTIVLVAKTATMNVPIAIISTNDKWLS